MFISGFRSQRPRFESAQADGLKWLAWIHSQFSPTPAPFEKLFQRYGCGPERIAFRSYESPDYCRFSDETISKFKEETVAHRMGFFADVAERRVDEFFEGITAPPSMLIHVTCTGYVAPSAAQKIVLNKGWHRETEILHAYHMGCYAALPAVRAAASRLKNDARRVDVVHNELCTLHLNPKTHTPEQIVVQSLFADGHIGYSVSANPSEPSLQILGIREELVPNTENAMTWDIASHGFHMTLARETPGHIGGAVTDFVTRLAKSSNVSIGDLQGAMYAIHPGGPRIVDLLEDILRLQPAQLEKSRKVLRERGNMSSATLPHIWKEIVDDPNFEPGKKIVSLAFGPGLTIFGAVMQTASS